LAVGLVTDGADTLVIDEAGGSLEVGGFDGAQPRPELMVVDHRTARGVGDGKHIVAAATHDQQRVGAGAVDVDLDRVNARPSGDQRQVARQSAEHVERVVATPQNQIEAALEGAAGREVRDVERHHRAGDLVAGQRDEIVVGYCRPR